MDPAIRLVATLALFVACGCGGEAPAARPERPLFEDVTERLGLDFVHRMGPRLTYFLPEIMGAGSALLDHDNDGDLDVYLIAGAASPGVEPFADVPRNRLFRQNPDHTFTDVSAGSGLDVSGFGMGVAVGDYDNDGWADVYVTNYGPNELFRNRGNGSFERVTERAGVGDPQWGTSATFLDYDADGWLDLFVANYLTLDREVVCRKDSGRPDYCDVGHFPGSSDRLYHNEGDGTFTDASASSGIAGPALKGLGVIAADFNDDGRVDLYVANDMQRNQLWINRGDGTFIDEAAERGVAYNEAGAVEASMGVIHADLDGDARLDLFVSNLSGQGHVLYRQRAPGIFVDHTAQSGIFAATQRYTGFGAGAIDVEHDGDVDLVVANGHVFRVAPEPGVALDPFWSDYAQRGLLLRNESGRFVEATAAAGAFGHEPQVGRGLAVGDVDEDGDLDFLVSNDGGRARLFFNVADKQGHWLMVGVHDDALRRDVPGSRVTLVAGERRWVQVALRGYSYLTSNDPRVHFGLGDVERIDAIEVRWPDGKVERFPGGDVDRHVRVVRGAGEIL